MKKFLSIALSALMLFALAVPTMAEDEETVKKLDYATLERDFEIVHYGTKNTTDTAIEGVTIISEDENAVLKTQGAVAGKQSGGIIIGNSNSNSAIEDTSYETGFRIKLINAGLLTRTFTMQMTGSNTDDPRLNIKFVSSSTTGKWALQMGSTVLADANKILQEDWNDFRFAIVEDTANQKATVSVYLNGVCLSDVECTYTKAVTENANRRPYQWICYNTSTVIETPIYLDDMYVAKYAPVTAFSQETVVASATVGQEVTLPSTVDVTADGVSETVNVIWEDVDTATAGTKTVYGIMDGYSVDVKAVATVTVTEPVTEPKHPYELTITDSTLTVTKAGTLNPDAKVYGAIYENGLLTDVQLLGSITSETVWTEGATTFSLDNGKVYRAFVINDELVPFAISTTLD